MKPLSPRAQQREGGGKEDVPSPPPPPSPFSIGFGNSGSGPPSPPPSPSNCCLFLLLLPPSYIHVVWWLGSPPSVAVKDAKERM